MLRKYGSDFYNSGSNSVSIVVAVLPHSIARPMVKTWSITFRVAKYGIAIRE